MKQENAAQNMGDGEEDGRSIQADCFLRISTDRVRERKDNESLRLLSKREVKAKSGDSERKLPEAFYEGVFIKVRRCLVVCYYTVHRFLQFARSFHTC